MLLGVLVATACGPCSALRRDFDERWRYELQQLALGDRVDVGGQEHATLRVSPEALRAISNITLRDAEVFTRSITVHVPSEAWDRAGNIYLELEIRADQVSSGDRLAYYGTHDVELRLSILAQARFEIPGKRARWTWSSSAAVRVPAQIDDGDGESVMISFSEAELITIDARLPWTAEEVPDAVGDIIYNGIAASIDAVLMENQSARFPLVRVADLELSRVSLPVRVSALRIEPQSGVMELGLSTALRPERRPASRASAPAVPLSDDEIGLWVPVETLDAAVRQQSLRGATPTTITIGENDEDRWVALWSPSTLASGVWTGTWELWCLETSSCRRTSLPAEARAWAVEGRLITARDPIPARFGDEGAPGTAGLASLAELQRSTLSELPTSIARWLSQLRQDLDLDAEMRSVTLDEGALYTVFRLR